MADHNESTKDNVYRIKEGMVKKGGHNDAPTTPRPSKPPAAQATGKFVKR